MPEAEEEPREHARPLRELQVQTAISKVAAGFFCADSRCVQRVRRRLFAGRARTGVDLPVGCDRRVAFARARLLPGVHQQAAKAG